MNFLHSWWSQLPCNFVRFELSPTFLTWNWPLCRIEPLCHQLTWLGNKNYCLFSTPKIFPFSFSPAFFWLLPTTFVENWNDFFWKCPNTKTYVILSFDTFWPFQPLHIGWQPKGLENHLIAFFLLSRWWLEKKSISVKNINPGCFDLSSVYLER